MEPKKTIKEESKKNGDEGNSNKLKQKVLSSDSLDKLPFAIDEDLLDEDEEDDKIIPISPLTDSFVFINKENLGEGSSRSKYLMK